MKTNLIIILAIIAVLILGGGIYFLTQQNNPSANNIIPDTSNNQQSNNSSGNQPASISSGNPTVHTIEISNFAFSPATLTISVGDSVIWTNGDSVSHTVTSDSGNELSSSPLGNGQTYSHTFATAGTFSYHCSIHPMMKGTIVVQ
jgi:plastocyanin